MKFTKSLEKKEKSQVKLTVTIPQTEVSKAYKESLEKYSKTIQIPGFRKGKVPVNVLESKFGESLKGEVAGDLMEKSLDKIFETSGKYERPLPYATPAIDEVPEFEQSKDFTFAVSYDVFPEVKIGTIDGFKIELPQVKLGEAELNEELKAIQERNAMVIDCSDDTKAEKEHIATVNYCELDDEKNIIEGSKREDFVFTIGSGQNIYKFDDEVIGMKKDETKDFSKNFPKDFEDEELAGKSKNIQITLTALKKRDVPELDDELAQDVSEKYKTLEDLKADINKNLETALENKLQEIKTNSLLENILEKHEFELPESMVQAELESQWRMMAQQFKTDTEQLEKIITSSGKSKAEMLEEWRESSEKRLKSRVIVEILIFEREIEVSPEDVEAEYEKIASGAGVNVDEVKQHYSDPQIKEYLIDDIKEKRLYNQLLENCTITKGEKKSFAELFN